MKSFRIILVSSTILFVESLKLGLTDGGSQIVSKFVSDLVRDAVASEKSNFFDILLIRMENKTETNIYGEIAAKVSPAAMLTVDCYYPRKVQILQRFSIIILITDDNNGVRKFKFSFKSNKNFFSFRKN